MTPKSNREQAALAASIAAMASSLLLYRYRIAIRKPRRSSTTIIPDHEALLRVSDSRRSTPWARVTVSGSDGEFGSLFNVTRVSFYTELLPLFSVRREQVNYGSPFRNGVKTRGRKATVHSKDLLAIALHYLCTTKSLQQLRPFFGMTQSSLAEWLDYSIRVLYQVVTSKHNKEFEIRWPTFIEQEESASLLKNEIHPVTFSQDIFGITDGGRFPCADYINLNVQNAFSEGYTQRAEVTNVFVFNFKGELIFAAINFPGTWHDSEIADRTDLYHEKLSDRMTEPGMAILGDDVFVNDTGAANGKIVRSKDVNEANMIPEAAGRAAIDIILRAYSSEHQHNTEWGVCAIKGPFKRLSTVLPADSQRRQRIIACCCHLFNYRTRALGQD